MSKHSHYDKFIGQVRTDKIENMKTSITSQQTLFVKCNKDSENILRASFIISSKIAKKSKPYSDGEFLNECISEIVEILVPEKKSIIDNISISRRTVVRRINEMSENIQET